MRDDADRTQRLVMGTGMLMVGKTKRRRKCRQQTQACYALYHWSHEHLSTRSVPAIYTEIGTLRKQGTSADTASVSR